MREFEGVFLHHHPAPSPFAILVFSGALHEHEAHDYYLLRTFVADQGIECVAITSKDRDFFLSDSTEDAVREAVALIGDKPFITLSQSMGCHAAVRLGHLIPAEAIMLFGPVMTLDPRELDCTPREEEYLNLRMDWFRVSPATREAVKMPVAQHDIRTIVVSDPYEAGDVRTLDIMREKGLKFDHFPAPGQEHHCVEAAEFNGYLPELIDLARRPDGTQAFFQSRYLEFAVFEMKNTALALPWMMRLLLQARPEDRARLQEQYNAALSSLLDREIALDLDAKPARAFIGVLPDGTFLAADGDHATSASNPFTGDGALKPLLFVTSAKDPNIANIYVAEDGKLVRINTLPNVFGNIAIERGPVIRLDFFNTAIPVYLNADATISALFGLTAQQAAPSPPPPEASAPRRRFGLFGRRNVA